jgi:hypothetical protein
MPESNYAALGQGLKLYTDAMRRFAKERLIARYPNTWWEDGVVRTLTDAQKASLKRDTEREPKKDKLDHIDATHLVRVVSRNFDHAFQGVFGDFQKTQSLLTQVASARNDWAHPRTGDMLADDVAHALYAMAQVLSAAGLPEASEVEKIRKDVLGMAQAPVPAPEAKPVRPAKEGELPYWWQVCEPYDAFKNPAAIDESLFAATLGAVHAGAARDEYMKPDVFFGHTYFTENLKQTIRDVASRLSGGPGPSVTELQTPFGGGKTHALLALYHLIKSPQESLAVPGVKDAIGDVVIPLNARVLVFDGQEYGTDPWVKEDTTSVFSMWGELAYQADPKLFRRLITDSDSRGEAPGNALFRQVLEAASPCLILIDELVSYLVKLRFSNTKRTQNLYRQSIQFVQELFQLVGNVPGVCVLTSLPMSRTEFGGLDPEQLQRELSVLPDLQARADRVVSKRTPVNDEEIYTLMSKRLFKKVDRETAERVARMYRETYERTRGLYDATVFSADYFGQQVEAYPLHPELIDVLYKKWSTAGDFPRTRSVLQLLASVVADQWLDRREAYAIQSAHVNLERERIRTKVVSAAGGGGWEGVVAADIIGGDARADMLDQSRGNEYERFHITRGVATTALMHSFGGQTRLGAVPMELRLGTVAPNIGPEYVSEVLDTLEQSLGFVHREGELLRFQTRPNPYRLIALRAETLPPAQVAERLQASLADALGSAPGFRVLDWAGTDGIIADSPELRIAVLEPLYAVSQENSGAKLAGRERIDRLWEKVGGGLREWRNALILVAPDSDLWGKAEEAMREVMAYEVVLGDIGKKTVDVSQSEQKDLESRSRDKRESLRTSITTAYRWVFYPDEPGLAVIALSVPATRDERIASRVVTRLSDQNYGHPKILPKMGAVYFNSKLAPRLWKDEATALDLEEMSRRFQQWTYLPILPNREETLRACIREGMASKLWAVAIGDRATSTYQRLIDSPGDLDSLIALFDGSASLVKGDLLELIREELCKEAGPVATSPTEVSEEEAVEVSDRAAGGGTETIPAPKRLRRIRLRIDAVGIGKTSNLQPYLFKVLQEQDAGAELTIVVEVDSGAGIPTDVLEKRIVEAFDLLGISVRWEAG